MELLYRYIDERVYHRGGRYYVRRLTTRDASEASADWMSSKALRAGEN